MRGPPGHSSQPHARLLHSFLGVYACVTSRLNVALFDMLCVSLMCFAYFFKLVSTIVFITRHWQTSGRQVQELNVRTVRVLGVAQMAGSPVWFYSVDM